MKKTILALAGEMGSGKGAISRYLISKYHAEVHRGSDQLRDILDRMHIEKNRENISNLSTALRGIFGDDILSKTIVGDIGQSDNPLIIIDGVRRREDLYDFQKLEGFIFVYVDADIDTRYARVVSRGENISDTTKTLAEFLKESKAETETRISGLRDIADRVIENNGTMEELQEKIEEILENNGTIEELQERFEKAVR